MKPMIALILFGVLSTGVILVIGMNLRDGVVETRAFDASLHYEADQAIIKELKKSITFNDLARAGGRVFFAGIIGTEQQPLLVLYSTKRDIKYNFTLDNGTYFINDNVKPGWYNLEFLYSVDNRTVPVRYSYYLN